MVRADQESSRSQSAYLTEGASGLYRCEQAYELKRRATAGCMASSPPEADLVSPYTGRAPSHQASARAGHHSAGALQRWPILLFFSCETHHHVSNGTLFRIRDEKSCEKFGKKAPLYRQCLSVTSSTGYEWWFQAERWRCHLKNQSREALVINNEPFRPPH